MKKYVLMLFMNICKHLYIFYDKSNDQYFTILIKFVALFREWYDISKNKEKAREREVVTNKLTPEGLPDLWNLITFLELKTKMIKMKLLK